MTPPRRCGRAERGGRGRDVPGVDTAADVRGGEDQPVLRHQGRLLDREAEGAPEAGEHGQVAGRPVAEAEVVALDHDGRVQRLDQHVVHEGLGAELRERRGERDDAERVDAELLDQLGLAHRLGQHGRVRAGPHDLGRVRVEGHDDRVQAEVAGPLHGVPDDRLVAAVHAVEDADRHHRSAESARHRLVPPPPLHSAASPGPDLAGKRIGHSRCLKRYS
nr:hypothetical protein GCM10020092_018730 [Actinoplanes digitatis]